LAGQKQIPRAIKLRFGMTNLSSCTTTRDFCCAWPRMLKVSSFLCSIRLTRYWHWQNFHCWLTKPFSNLVSRSSQSQPFTDSSGRSLPWHDSCTFVVAG